MLVKVIAWESFTLSTSDLNQTNIIWRMDAIDKGPSANNKLATVELLKMYEMDTPCECDIFRIVSPIDFKFDLWCHTT